MILAKKLLMGINKPSEPSEHYLEFVSSTPMTITPNYTNTGVTLQYSLDTVTWTNIAAKEVTPSATTVYFRGRATGSKSLFTSIFPSNAWLFTGATNLEVNGNITMLLQDEFGGNVQNIPLNAYAFSYMFQSCTSLTVAPELPSTTLADYCYDGMFSDCPKLTVAPELPATTLASYCYDSMFYWCTGLTVAPALPATTLASDCYVDMFNNCTSLTTAPELPATTLAARCYNRMFYGCTKLTVAHELPATTLVDFCYNYMFYNCTKLTVAPELPATTLASYCYNGMFLSCSSLTVAPALPATTLAINCYSDMFSWCTGLTVVPELPATTLANDCYNYMFNGCNKIKLSTTKTGNYQTAYRVPTVGTGVTATNSLTNMFSNTGGTFVGAPTINTTYYTENQVI